MHIGKRNSFRVCPFCEATCGVALELEGGRIRGVRGDKDDPFSRGCVVSLPHGFGHHAEGSAQRVAKAHPGVNANALTDDRAYDTATGTAVLFGTPVTIEPIGEPAAS